MNLHICTRVNLKVLRAIHSFCISFHSGANIHAEDQKLCTPDLTAAANKKVEAFHCLMELIDLKNDQRNPIFQVLHVKKHRVETLEVSLHIVSRLALVGC